MTKEDEIHLYQSSDSQEDFKHRLVEKFINSYDKYLKPMFLLYKKKYRNLTEGDFKSSAYYGIIEAADRYDVHKPFLFITYAKFWIAKYVIKDMKDFNHSLTVPDYLKDKENSYRMLSLADDDTSHILQDDELPIEHSIIEEETRKEVVSRMDCLDELEYEIIARFYGILDHKPMSFKEIAQELKIEYPSVTEDYIKTVKYRAMRRMRRCEKDTPKENSNNLNINIL